MVFVSAIRNTSYPINRNQQEYLESGKKRGNAKYLNTVKQVASLYAQSTKHRFQSIRSAILFLGFVSIPALQASTRMEIIQAFERPGSQPRGQLFEHSNGTVYGTTVTGGVHNLGTIFAIGSENTVTTIHSFAGLDGAAPIAGLVEGIDGSLYGSTAEGGDSGFGVVFKITIDGDYTKLVDFTGSSGASKGSVPNGLASHDNGSIYGTTQAGGDDNAGTLFSISPSGQFSNLLDFTGASGSAPGQAPIGAIAIVDNRIFGLTQFGGDSNDGTLFQASLTGAIEASISFTGVSGDRPGSRPSSSLLIHSDGNLYGTTEFGGPNGVGVAFKFDIVGAPVYTPLHSFADATGSQPSGALAEVPGGAIYGTTAVGGSNGWGVVFSMTTAGSHSVITHLSNVAGGNIGASPRSGLTTLESGNLIGTASAGGPGQRGLVFRIAAGNAYEVLDDFTNDTGWFPSGPPIHDRNGGMLFPLAQGGTDGAGTVALLSEGAHVSTLFPLGAELGSHPIGEILDTGSSFAGLTSEGSLNGRGAVFTFDSDANANLLTPFSSVAGESLGGPLTQLDDGTLYGVARRGGFANQGVVFTVSGQGAIDRLFSFTGGSGSNLGSGPIAPLLQSPNGTLYGLTHNTASQDDDGGTLFKIDTNGVRTTVIDFSNTEVSNPSSGLVIGTDGLWYATTAAGGDSGHGAIISFNGTADTWELAASFNSPTTGSRPNGPVLIGPNGNLYGFTTEGGFNGFGSIYRFNPDSGILETLIHFSGREGANPGLPVYRDDVGAPFYGGLGFGQDGVLYGVAPGGGPLGGGTLFRLSDNLAIQDWKLENLGDANAPDNGDTDRDGLTNLEEYAFGLSPILPDNQSIIKLLPPSEPNRLAAAIQFQRNSTHTDIDVFVEAANSPAGPWTIISSSLKGQPFSGNAATELIQSQGNIQFFQVTDVAGLGAAKKRFLRLRISP